MEHITQIITQYGLDTTLCAVLTTVLVGVLKMPIKKLVLKCGGGSHITRYITFLPFLIGFGLVTLYTYFDCKAILFNRLFFTRWLGSVSASLAIYAFWEKFIPSKKKILTEAEISANRTVLQEIQSFINHTTNAKTDFLSEHASEEKNTSDAAENIDAGSDMLNRQAVPKKIVLRGGNHAQIE